MSPSPRLVSPPALLAIGIAGLLFFTGCALLSALFLHKTFADWTTALFLACAAVDIMLIGGYFIARHDITDTGLSYKPLFGKRRFIPWSTLTQVRFVATTKTLYLQYGQGGHIKISALMMGLPALAQQLLAHAPQGVIEAATLPVLQATAGERLPVPQE